MASPKRNIRPAEPGLHPRVQELLGLVVLAVAAFILVALVTFAPADPSLNNAAPLGTLENNAGLIGAYLSDLLLMYFGAGAYILPLVLLGLGLQWLLHDPVPNLGYRAAVVPLVMTAISTLFYLWQPIPHWPVIDGVGNGGLVGVLLGQALTNWLGLFGAVVVPLLVALATGMFLTGLTLRDLWYGLTVVGHYTRLGWQHLWRFIVAWREADQLEIDLPLPRPAPRAREKPVVERPAPLPDEDDSDRAADEQQTALPLSVPGDYTLPSLSLLEKNTEADTGPSEDALTQNARMLEAQLANFGVEGNVTKVSPGPVVTIYELEPAVGVKTSKVVGLADDLARAMSATAIRIAPIPGKTVIGVEMPNRQRRGVRLRELLATDEFNQHPGKLVVALGVDTTGKPIYTDIAKMPHALVAGTTGSGKSVAINAFILSLVYRLSPQDLRLIMVDPKMLELSGYNGIPHLLTPVVTDPAKAAAALKWAVKEMENRYRLMSELGVKNISSFNEKFLALQAEGKVPTRFVQTGFDPTTGRPKLEEQQLATEKLPYIVVIIDELADLMLVAGKQVESSIARLAQMARAAGIHLMVATQRPSVDVITGLIKANIPTRISFNLMSKIDSRTILDQMGAEQLLGKGDMLYLANGSNALQRCHGAFVSEDECEKVAAFLKAQGEPHYIDQITVDVSADGAEGNAAGGPGAVDPNDPLYRQAIELVAREGKASTSFIQRHLKIGYNRAATLIEQMERDGLVGPSDHVGKREVLMRPTPEGGY